MSTDYRALCAELHTAVQLYTGQNPAAAETPANELVARLMAALAATATALVQPEPEGVGVSDEDDMPRLLRRLIGAMIDYMCLPGHVITRDEWEKACLQSGRYCEPFLSGPRSLKPVPVAEQLPGPEDCCGNPRNGRGRWCWGRVLPQTDAGTPVVWRLMLVECLIDEATHWLPHHALPLPTPTP